MLEDRKRLAQLSSCKYPLAGTSQASAVGKSRPRPLEGIRCALVQSQGLYEAMLHLLCLRQEPTAAGRPCERPGLALRCRLLDEVDSRRRGLLPAPETEKRLDELRGG